MPELPEVSVVVSGLNNFLVGKKVADYQAFSPASLQAEPNQLKKFLLRAQILKVERAGKLIIINLDSGYSLAVHLKMTGQLVFKDEKKHFGAGHPSPSLIGQLPDKTSRVVFELQPTSRLFFNDGRRFGWVKLWPTSKIKDLTGHLGPDALIISQKEFAKRLAPRSRIIKACLLDQTILAGVGNIYADESLWLARIHPSTPANKLTKSQTKELLNQLQFVLKLSINKGGSSSSTYINAEGKKGRYLDFVKAYGRFNQPCYRCQRPLTRVKIAGRSSHYCLNCQKLKK